MFPQTWGSTIYNDSFTKEIWGEWDIDTNNAEDAQFELERCNNEFEE